MKHSVYGHEVDLDPDTGRKILSEAPIRVVDVDLGERRPYNRPEIEYEGEWISLCRTDLQDDVATGVVATKTAEEWREYYLGRIIFGVRIKPTAYGGIDGVYKTPTKRRFSCIDAYSDG